MAKQFSSFMRFVAVALASSLMATAPVHASKSDRVTKMKGKPAVSAASAGKRPAASKAKPVAKANRSAAVAQRRQVHRSVVEARSAARPTFGQLAGLHLSADEIGLKSNAVMVLDQQTNEVLFDKNAKAVLPIASITKLMTALIVADAMLPLDESITITEADVDTLKGSGSRLAVGTTLTRGEMLHLALMSSENRAAHALGRTYPEGLGPFVDQMNAKAKSLGMSDTKFVDPTGLSPQNQSNAKDLAKLVTEAYGRPIIRELSTSPSHAVEAGHRTLQYRNSNQLVSNPQWEIGVQKTGYISEAGRCLVMQATVAGRQLVMVFLDSAGKLTRIADAERVRKWAEARLN
ncbi:MAG TPA: serine hydrolase [Burkholderiaceae bacterium]|nr:serine hydrolase [Burkholderiaceae bacterium]